MSSSLTPAKRSHGDVSSEVNGRGKWPRSSSFEAPQQCNKNACLAVFRLLCPASKFGKLTGSFIDHITQETGAFVNFEEAVPGCDERVIAIIGSERDAECGLEQHDNSMDDHKDLENNKVDVKSEDLDNNEGIGQETQKNLKHGGEGESAQKALLLIFERITIDGDKKDERDEEHEKSSVVTARLLVLSSQVGCLLGRGGSVIKRTTAESGASIKVSRANLPPCALPLEELVNIIGALDAVKKALQIVSQQILDNPPRNPDTLPLAPGRGGAPYPSAPFPHPDIFPPNFNYPPCGVPFMPDSLDHGDHHFGMTFDVPKVHGNATGANILPEMLTFRVLCPNEKVGNIIGKGGFIVKSIQRETGADVQVVGSFGEPNDRIISVSGLAHPDERISPVQEALIRVQSKIASSGSDNTKVPSARLLILPRQTGCLIGKGGAIIAEMRRVTGASIYISGKDQLPKRGNDREEVVQITGEIGAVQNALLHVTTRLRDHLFREKYPSTDLRQRPDVPDQAPAFPPYMERRDPLLPGLHSAPRPPIYKFDAPGDFPQQDEQTAFMPTINRTGSAPSLSDKTHTSMPWSFQGVGDGNPSGNLNEYPAMSQRKFCGFGGDYQSNTVRPVPVEVVIPRALVPSIYGENGGCLRRIREISGARITITEPRPGTAETVVLISGAPDETHAAQSLLQAFVISGPSSP